MRLIEKRNQHRRDFTGVYRCESCGYEKVGSGYDDNYFHRHVIPAMECPVCNESSVSLGSLPQETRTKYADWQVV